MSLEGGHPAQETDRRPGSARRGRTAGRLLAAAEAAAVAALFAADAARMVPFSKTPFLLLLGWASLRLRGLRWRDVGLHRPADMRRALALGCLAGSCMSLIELTVTHPLATWWAGQPPDLSDLLVIEGNLAVLGLALLLAWVVAALGEEAVYRGFLMSRAAGLLGGSRAAWWTSLAAVGLLFGAGHIDQGITGMMENTWNGWLLGGLYLACGRRLAVPIIAHGVQDTLDLVLIYLGLYPGL
ncbi:MAG TPA: CPBP family intramembrane glutamic endopeptidase [Candidatus Polarisedimenticolia bacterium]|nr:CPBP family intramembrane glutamic endopeptidase [Candidatus Polarisedimenticolia bacterium]